MIKNKNPKLQSKIVASKRYVIHSTKKKVSQMSNDIQELYFVHSIKNGSIIHKRA